ncbi:MAG: cyclin-dependent kinase 4 inhibitor, partial [Pseudomonadota bacterium]
DSIRQLAHHGASLDIQDDQGDTPLHMAVFDGHTAVVTTLLACNANPRIANLQRETPLDMARRLGRAGIAYALEHYIQTPAARAVR